MARIHSLVLVFGAASFWGAPAFTQTPIQVLNLAVRVDSTSKDYPSEVITGKVSPVPDRLDVRVSDGSRTYQLTCNYENTACSVPNVGSHWQMTMRATNEPQELDDTEGEFPYRGFDVALRGPAGGFGPFWLVADMPALGEQSIAAGISNCKAKEQGINENDCVVWLARRARLQEQGCSGGSSDAGCSDFLQLLGASDPDLLDVLARLRHVYVCSRPQTSDFFLAYFSETFPWHWTLANERDVKDLGVAMNDLWQFGSPGIFYYDQGIRNEGNSVTAMGVWRYRKPLDISPANLALVATTSDAKFHYDDPNLKIYIDGTRLSVEELYKSREGSEIKHTLLLQRSTGRFKERYEHEDTGSLIVGYSGECREVPEATQ